MPEATGVDAARPLTLWRAYVPRWAHAPLSGEGAATFGGRWNAVGQPCLYAACELSTAWAEYNQGFVQHPATLVQLVLTGAKLTDLTDGETLIRLDQTMDLHRTQWRADLDEARTPLTHGIHTPRAALREGLSALSFSYYTTEHEQE
jgi:RES domain-containing protein